MGAARRGRRSQAGAAQRDGRGAARQAQPGGRGGVGSGPARPATGAAPDCASVAAPPARSEPHRRRRAPICHSGRHTGRGPPAARPRCCLSLGVSPSIGRFEGQKRHQRPHLSVFSAGPARKNGQVWRLDDIMSALWSPKLVRTAICYPGGVFRSEDLFTFLSSPALKSRKNGQVACRGSVSSPQPGVERQRRQQGSGSAGSRAAQRRQQGSGAAGSRAAQRRKAGQRLSPWPAAEPVTVPCSGKRGCARGPGR